MWAKGCKTDANGLPSSAIAVGRQSKSLFLVKTVPRYKPTRVHAPCPACVNEFESASYKRPFGQIFTFTAYSKRNGRVYFMLFLLALHLAMLHSELLLPSMCVV